MHLQKSFMKPSVLLLAFSLSTATLPVWAELVQEEHAAMEHAPAKVDWPGVYQGFTPCADCIGIKTSLALNKNNSYVLMTQNVGKSIREFVEKGKFTWDEKSGVMAMTARNSEVIRHYLVGQNSLTELDSKGKAYTGEQASRYVLKRNDSANSPDAHDSHSGH